MLSALVLFICGLCRLCCFAVGFVLFAFVFCCGSSSTEDVSWALVGVFLFVYETVVG